MIEIDVAITVSQLQALIKETLCGRNKCMVARRRAADFKLRVHGSSVAPLARQVAGCGKGRARRRTLSSYARVPDPT